MMSTSCPGFLDRHGVWNNGIEHVHLLVFFSRLASTLHSQTREIHPDESLPIVISRLHAD